MPAHRNREGRQDVLEELRALLTIVGSLTSEGDTISSDVISQKLGVTPEEADKLLDMLIAAGSYSGSYLPLVYVDGSDSRLSMQCGRGVLGKPLRLTPQESVALIAALQAVGVGLDNPLIQHIRQSYSATTVDDRLSRNIYSLRIAPEERDVLELCSKAIVEREAIGFTYETSGDARPSYRVVYPTSVYPRETAWYCDGYDQGRRGERTFAVQRMKDVHLVIVQDEDPQRNIREDTSASARGERRVTLYFADRRFLDVFGWPGLEIVTKDEDGCTVATIPYYGSSSSWLPRMLAACGGTVTCDDAEIRASAVTYAKGLLQKSHDMGES